MRKRTIHELSDTLFWYILYALPILMYLLSAIRHDVPAFVTFMTDNLGFVFTSTNPILSAIVDLFGTDGILPFFTDSSAAYMCTWFICVFIMHLAVDFVLFIPRLAHKYMSKCTQGD